MKWNNQPKSEMISSHCLACKDENGEHMHLYYLVYLSVGVMRRFHCQVHTDVTVEWYYSRVYSHLTHAELAWGISDLLMLPRLSVITGEHANYSQIMTIGFSLFTQFMTTFLYEWLLTQIPIIFINIAKTYYLLINNVICSTPDT